MIDFMRGYRAGLAHAASVARAAALGLVPAHGGWGSSGKGPKGAVEAANAIAEAIENERERIRAGVSGDNSGGGNGR